MQVYLIRHTTPNIAKGICYGQLDVSIEPTCFEKEFENIQMKLPKGIEQCYSSPLIRCSHLAQRLFGTPVIDANLMEINFGDWENIAWNEIPSDKLTLWMNDFVNIKTPNGESYIDLHFRNTQFLNSILEKEYQKVAVVTHAGNIRSIISYVLDLPLQNSFKIELNYGSVVCITIDNNAANNKLNSIM